MANLSRYYTYVQPLMQTPKTRAYGMFVLSLFALAFFGFFAIRPTLTTVLSLNRQITDAEQLDKALADKITAINAAQEVLTRIEPRQDLLVSAIPKTPNIAALMRLLDAKAASAKVTLGNVNVRTIILNGEEAKTASASGVLGIATKAQAADSADPTDTASTPAPAAPGKAPAASFTEIKLQTTASGTIQQLTDFLQLLATSRRIIDVESIRLATREKDANLNLDISLKAYQKN